MLVAIVTFLSAFLLFAVQMLMGKVVLPWFGGSAGVWTTCMLFFQVLLLLGYLYAHNIAMRPRGSAVHIGLLGISVLALVGMWVLYGTPLLPPPAWRPPDSAQPILRILTVLVGCVGLPFLVLASTSVLVQAWVARRGVVPYRLYAISNIGSVLGLVSYPFAIEPALGLRQQAAAWSVLYVVCVCGLVVLSGQAAARSDVPVLALERPKQPVFMWLALATCPSILLLAVTNQLCLDVASIPFLWMLPLVVYLLSFIICFDRPAWADARVWWPLMGVVLVGAAPLICMPAHSNLPLQIVAYGLLLLVLCMICHGELVRLRPAPEHLTRFYLAVAAGGALGGVLVNIVAPLVFTGFWELEVGLGLAALLMLRRVFSVSSAPTAVWAGSLLLMGGLILLAPVPRAPLALLLGGVVATLLWMWHRKLALWPPTALVGAFCGVLVLVVSGGPSKLEHRRDFYGVLTIEQTPHHVALMHGSTLHGLQVRDPESIAEPTTYYTSDSGIGRIFKVLEARHPALHVGAVGLGAGTVATYGRAGDSFEFYEINPQVVALSTGPSPLFTYLHNNPAQMHITVGDGRLQLERELAAGQHEDCDLLIIDAFSSDAIPVHLITREAFAVYRQRLKPQGVLAIHLTNHYFDLIPEVRQLAEATGLKYALVGRPKQSYWGTPSWWMLMSPSADLFEDPLIQVVDGAFSIPNDQRPALWTDDYANLFGALK